MIRDARSLLLLLNQRGASFWLENGRLRMRAPKGTVSPEDLGLLKSMRAEIIRLLENERRANHTPICVRAPGCAVPLTTTQSRWMKRCGKVQKRALSGPKTVTRVRGTLKIDILQWSFDALLRRHESLRTRIIGIDGAHFQQVDAAHPCEFEAISLSRETPTQDIERATNRLIEAFLAKDIDISEGPLFAAMLIMLSDREHVLVIALNHLVSDAVSTDIVHSEIWTLYGQAARGLAPTLPELPIQFPDYAVWQAETYEAWMIQHAPYWRERLAGVQSTEIPVRDGLIEVSDPGGDRLFIEFGKLLSNQLCKVAQREKALLALIVLTLYVVVMAHWCEQNDLLIAFQSNGRFSPELENVIGYVAGDLHLRVVMDQSDTFQDLLKRVAGEFYNACDHFDFGRTPDLTPNFRTELAFSWVAMRGEDLMNGACMAGSQDELALESLPYIPVAAYKFSAAAFEGVSGIYVSVMYRPDIFLRSTIERFGTNLIRAAEWFVRDPSVQICDISFN